MRETRGALIGCPNPIPMRRAISESRARLFLLLVQAWMRAGVKTNLFCRRQKIIWRCGPPPQSVPSWKLAFSKLEACNVKSESRPHQTHRHNARAMCWKTLTFKFKRRTVIQNREHRNRHFHQACCRRIQNSASNRLRNVTVAASIVGNESAARQLPHRGADRNRTVRAGRPVAFLPHRRGKWVPKCLRL
jgi:hypothetical protein